MHLAATSKTLNLFAATGRIYYAKSARMYLQQMLELPTKHPSLFESFLEDGYHTIRRSNCFWAGLWSDLIIEQVMMRLIKSRRSLTTGRGFTDSSCHQWVHTTHECAVIHEAMTNVTQLTTSSSEQHIELGTSRKSRDYADLTTVQEWFSLHKAFFFGFNLFVFITLF